ncbi:MAG: 2-amino-4-hydroxy-6-hydroxymethyldihydropteridine diphosphokinase [Nitrospirae bacterium]|nr:2-amino-4-hydroxy-6-hydroxymethyldihydropteridine diphosphokinase [Nitrospirota bacterium]
MPTAYIGIGSNLGDREENCMKAVSLLRDNGIKVTKPSSMIETEPWGLEGQPKFINMAVEAETALSPDALLKLLKNIESEIGREESVRWGPRVIDLDILLYGDLVLKTPELEIPHPHIAGREFVLKPLSEIAPEKIHPVLKKSISELFSQYPRNS